jgi:hypothetical protein
MLLPLLLLLPIVIGAGAASESCDALCVRLSVC